MEPQTTNQMMSEPEQKCPWYQPLCKVTPVSKYLAMAIFVALPFIGGYVGYQFALIEYSGISYGKSRDTEIIIKTDNTNLEVLNNSDDIVEMNNPRFEDPSIFGNQQTLYEDYNLSTNELFQKHFSTSGDFNTSRIQPVPLSGIYGGGGTLEFIPSKDIFLTGEATVTFEEYFNSWLLQFVPDSDSIGKIPQLKSIENISFSFVSPEVLCQKIKCDRAIGTYKLKLKVFNPTLYYEVIPSDTGAFKYNLRADTFEVIQ
jgi:hypothetical protein